jgi:DNA-binding CsgD family transcriptional regulator
VAAEVGLANPVTVPFRGDLCEALVGAGDLDRAKAEHAVLVAEAEHTGLRWPAAVSSRVAALIAHADAGGTGKDSDADALFRGALSQWPDGFAGARTRLYWGESLAKRGRSGDARALLLDASLEFARLGAKPFLTRVEAALAGTGEPVRAVRPAPLAVLTGAELQVALAVADGLSNRDIAARLFISPKTVEHHLTHAYQKLNARSRTDLARLVLTERAAASNSST